MFIIFRISTKCLKDNRFWEIGFHWNKTCGSSHCWFHRFSFGHVSIHFYILQHFIDYKYYCKIMYKIHFSFNAYQSENSKYAYSVWLQLQLNSTPFIHKSKFRKIKNPYKLTRIYLCLRVLCYDIRYNFVKGLMKVTLRAGFS